MTLMKKTGDVWSLVLVVQFISIKQYFYFYLYVNVVCT